MSNSGLLFADYFAEDLKLLAPLAKMGWWSVDEKGIQVTAKGRLLIRNICMCFDIYLRQKARMQQFSRVIKFVPVRFTSWMGGDRDGNPNVTADITRHVLLLSRWKATDLFLKDIQVLVSELSMVEATPELLALVGEEGAAEPYRYLMKNLRSRLMATQAWLEARLKGEELPKPEGLLTQNEELWEPLYACYQSLQACGMGIIANGDLLDTLRRVKCFGVPLVRY